MSVILFNKIILYNIFLIIEFFDKMHSFNLKEDEEKELITQLNEPIKKIKLSLITEKIKLIQFFEKFTPEIKKIKKYMDDKNIFTNPNLTRLVLKNKKLKKAYEHYLNDSTTNIDNEHPEIIQLQNDKMKMFFQIDKLKFILNVELPFLNEYSYSLIPLKNSSKNNNKEFSLFYDRENDNKELLFILNFIETDEYYFNFMYNENTLKIIKIPLYLLSDFE